MTNTGRASGVWPLTPLQLGMVSQTLHGRGPGTYIQQFVCRTARSVETRILRDAVAILTARHPALRLHFHWNPDGEVFQTVEPAVEPLFAEQPWPGENAFQSWLKEDRRRGVRLRQAPLHRWTVFHIPGGGTVLLMTSHHAILDGRSRRIVMAELLQLIDSGRPNSDQLPPPPAPFTAYLDWIGTQDDSASTAYWHELLAGISAGSDLPLPVPAVPDDTSTGDQRCTIGMADTTALAALARDCECSLNNVVQAAWAITLSRYQGQPEAVFGVVRACRHWSGDARGKGMVGLLMNTVPVRCRIGPGVTVHQLLGQLRQQQSLARKHEHTSLRAIATAAGLAADDQVFRTDFMFDNASRSAPASLGSAGGWTVELYEQTQFLNLSAVAGSEIRLGLEYDPHRYSDASMRRLLSDVAELLKRLPNAIDRDAGSIDFFSPSALAGPAGKTGMPKSVVESVRDLSRSDGGREAVLSSRGSLTYAELDRRSDVLAGWLIARDFRHGAPVAVSIDRSPDLIVACLGIWKAGCHWVPVDPFYPEARRNFMVSDSGAVTILTALPADCDFTSCPSSEQVGEQADERAEHSAGPAYVIYTSGSTGQPKGIAISHASLSNLCDAIAQDFRLTPGDRVLQASSINFDISIEEIFPTLWSGGTIVLRDQDTMSSVREFLAFVGRWQCTVLDLPTAFWHELVEGLQPAETGLPPSVRLTVVGGERVLPAAYKTWLALPDSGRIRWLNTYGPTEATVTATLFDPAEYPPVWTENGDLPIGRPIKGVTVQVVDATLRPVPLETVGELAIGGAGVGIGYLGAPELNDRKFVPDPRSPGHRLYRTGDRARLFSGGQLEFLGRQDFQVKFRGFRIELTEIEKAAETHPAVAQALAQIRDGSVLVLFVTAGNPGVIDADAIRSWLSLSLPGWMVPDFVVPLAGFPVTLTGKIDRQVLASLPLGNSRDDLPSVPETDMERKLAAIWEALFRTAPLGLDDNFFALGGYSLLAMRLLVQIEAMTAQRLTFGDLSRAPTIRRLAALLSGEFSSGLPETIVPLNAVGKGPALFCFHGAGGLAHWYNDLAHELAGRRVFGIQSQRHAEGGQGTSLEEMAERYLADIRRVQPRGPYCFLGHSMGGLLAYHCSVLCLAAGEAVRFTGILDCRNVSVDNPGLAEKSVRWLRYFFALPWDVKRDFIREKLLWLRSARSLSAEQRQAGIDTTGEEAIKAMNVQAARRYLAPRYDGRVYLFRARSRSATDMPDPTMGWDRVAADVIVIEVPGDHYTLLSPPNVHQLAHSVRTILEVPE